jgi:hypothetical protein
MSSVCSNKSLQPPNSSAMTSCESATVLRTSYKKSTGPYAMKYNQHWVHKEGRKTGRSEWRRTDDGYLPRAGMCFPHRTGRQCNKPMLESLSVVAFSARAKCTRTPTVPAGSCAAAGAIQSCVSGDSSQSGTKDEFGRRTAIRDSEGKRSQ